MLWRVLPGDRPAGTSTLQQLRRPLPYEDRKDRLAYLLDCAGISHLLHSETFTAGSRLLTKSEALSMDSRRQATKQPVSERPVDVVD